MKKEKIFTKIKKDILKKKINELDIDTGLSCLKKYLEDSNLICCISAYRKGNTKEENNKQTTALRNNLSSLGYGYIELECRYLEEGADKTTPQVSFCVINNEFKDVTTEGNRKIISGQFVDEMRYLCSQYKQDSILIRYYVENDKFEVCIMKVNGSIDIRLSSVMNFDNIINYLTELKHRKFVLEDIDDKQASRKWSNYGNHIAAIGLFYLRNKIEKANFHTYKKYRKQWEK